MSLRNLLTEKAVISAWKVYHDHLNSYPREGEDQKERAAIWVQRKEELLATLLQRMGESLGYEFDPVQIRRGAYSPEGHATVEFELQLLQKMVIEWLGGDRKVAVTIVPKDEQAAKQGERFFGGVLGVVEGQRKIQVEVHSESAALQDKGKP